MEDGEECFKSSTANIEDIACVLMEGALVCICVKGSAFFHHPPVCLHILE